MAARFEWDENKDRINRTKHGISFDTAISVFADPGSIFRRDLEIDGEQRWQTLGSIGGGIVIILVVHTLAGDGDDHAIRIISARKATSRERRFYEEGDWSE